MGRRKRGERTAIFCGHIHYAGHAEIYSWLTTIVCETRRAKSHDPSTASTIRQYTFRTSSAATEVKHKLKQDDLLFVSFHIRISHCVSSSHIATGRRCLSLRCPKIVVASLHLNQCSIGGYFGHALLLSHNPTSTASQHVVMLHSIGMLHPPIVLPSTNLTLLYHHPFYDYILRQCTRNLSINESFSDFLCSQIYCTAPGKDNRENGSPETFSSWGSRERRVTALIALIELKNWRWTSMFLERLGLQLAGMFCISMRTRGVYCSVS